MVGRALQGKIYTSPVQGAGDQHSFAWDSGLSQDLGLSELKPVSPKQTRTSQSPCLRPKLCLPSKNQNLWAQEGEGTHRQARSMRVLQTPMPRVYILQPGRQARPTRSLCVCVRAWICIHVYARVLLCVFSRVCIRGYADMCMQSLSAHPCMQARACLWRPPMGLASWALSSCSIPELQPREGAWVCDIPILSGHSLWLCL